MSKTYFNDGDVTITNAMFITPDGSQYPVRNISAVRMKVETRRGWLIASVLFFIFSFFAQADFFVAFLIFSVLFLGIWFFGRNFQLIISSGGVEVAALSYNFLEKNKQGFIRQVLSALSLAVTDLQT